MRRLVLSAVLVLVTVIAVAQDKQSSNYAMVTDVPYVSDSDTSAYRRERCKLDIYHPTDKTGYPTIVWFHGGALEAGAKDVPQELRNAGLAVVAPNYRLFPRAKCPDYICDAAAAVAWTIRHIIDYGGDPSRVYVGGHSAGGYLSLMLALDKSYLAAEGIDADSIAAYYPVGGQTATHYTIRKERGIAFDMPIVDHFAPLNNARKLGTRIMLFTGDRRYEQMARYEENLYLKAVLEGFGNAEVPIFEISGFDHGNVVAPACLLIRADMLR